MVDTYQVKMPWETRAKGYLDETSGTTYKARRAVTTYERGKTNPIETHYVYKNVLKEAPKKEPTVPTLPGSGEPAPDYSDSLTGGLPPPEGTVPGDVQQGIFSPTSTVPIMPSGEPMFVGWSPTDLELFKVYGQYLNEIDSYNKNLEQQLKKFYDNEILYYNASPGEMYANMLNELKVQSLPRLSFEEWKIKSQKGLTSIPVSPKIPDSPGEMANLIAINEGMNKFITGMSIGWDVAQKLYLPQLAVLNALGSSDFFKRSDPQAQQLLKNVARSVTSEVLYNSDDIMAGISQLIDIQKGEGEKTFNENKARYERLNEQAKQRGLIKNDWKLKLSNNIPAAEKFRRLYVTLLDYITKKSKKTK